MYLLTTLDTLLLRPALHFATLHPTTLHSTSLHLSTLQFFPFKLHPLQCTTLHYTCRHFATSHLNFTHYTSLHFTTLSFDLTPSKLPTAPSHIHVFCTILATNIATCPNTIILVIRNVLTVKREFNFDALFKWTSDYKVLKKHLIQETVIFETGLEEYLTNPWTKCVCNLLQNSRNRHFSRSQWPCCLGGGCAATRLLGLRLRIPPCAWVSLVSAFCCQIDVSVTGRSLVRRIPTECGVWSSATKALRLQWVGTKRSRLKKKKERKNEINILSTLGSPAASVPRYV
jgi:hypothetical protein